MVALPTLLWWLPFERFRHQSGMPNSSSSILLQSEAPLAIAYYLRKPAEPMPPPIKEPPNPPENPDAPVREPDPEEPEQISRLPENGRKKGVKRIQTFPPCAEFF